MQRESNKRRIERLSLATAIVGGVMAGWPAAAPAQEPMNEDEWYDPTDWFDGNNVEWDDTYDFGYDDTYENVYPYDDNWDYEWNSDTQRWEYDYEPYGDVDDDNWDYEWNADSQRWEYDYEPYGDSYDGSYGYEWNAEENRWERDDGYDDRNDARSSSTRNDRRNENSNSARSASDGSRRDDSSRMEEFSGTIESFNRVRSADGSSNHTLVKVRLENGRTRTLDLGPRMNLQRADLAQGDRIRARGHRTTMNQRSVLDVQKLRVDGERKSLAQGSSNRPSDGSRRQSDRNDRGRVVFSGKVAGFHEAEVDGVDDQHVLIRLRTTDGRHRVIDLGPKSQLADVRLDNGIRISVRGSQKEVADGRTILKADSIRLETASADGSSRDRGSNDGRSSGSGAGS